MIKWWSLFQLLYFLLASEQQQILLFPSPHVLFILIPAACPFTLDPSFWTCLLWMRHRISNLHSLFLFSCSSLLSKLNKWACFPFRLTKFAIFIVPSFILPLFPRINQFLVNIHSSKWDRRQRERKRKRERESAFLVTTYTGGQRNWNNSSVKVTSPSKPFTLLFLSSPFCSKLTLSHSCIRISFLSLLQSVIGCSFRR